MKRKSLHLAKHPFNKHPFEAFYHGSWQSVERIEVSDGAMILHYSDNHCRIAEKGDFDIRIKSRRATLVDCTCFLRPGIDVCVLSSARCTDDSEEQNSGPVWLDAKISSIERKPHKSECSCQFFIKTYVKQGSLSSEIRGPLSKETDVVGINQISILQRVANSPCEGQFYRWDFSEDCSSVQRTKLLLGKFSSDVAWLLVASVIKQVAFDIFSARNKIIYQILGVDDDCYSLRFDNSLHSVSFEIENDVLTPDVVQFNPEDDNEMSPCDVPGFDASPSYDVMNLRRSKRRNVQPERFLACDLPPVTEFGLIRAMPYTPQKWKDEELYIPLSQLFAIAEDSSCQDQTEGEIGICSSEVEPSEGPVFKTKTRSRKAKSTVGNSREHKIQLDVAPEYTEGDDVALESEQLHYAAKTLGKYSEDNIHKKFNSHSKTHSSSDIITSKSIKKTPRDYSQKNNGISTGSYVSRVASSSLERKIAVGLEDMVVVNAWKGKAPTQVSYEKKNFERGRYRPIHPSKNNSYELMTYKKASLNDDMYNKLINSYMKSIDFTLKSKEEPHVINQWKEFKAKGCMKEQEKLEPSTSKDEEKSSGIEELWREMDLCLASICLFEDKVQVSSQTANSWSQRCKHEFRLDEEIGILCSICGSVKTEIKYVAAPFKESIRGKGEEKPHDNGNTELTPYEKEGLKLSSYHSINEVSLSAKTDTAWDLIPELRMKLHEHQKRAFEFLWRNVAGSMVPEHMEKESKMIGGCVISHTPGAGKTFLIIAFLASYLKLFPGKRPLVLAPKTTLYTWYKEFIKWEVSIPVHLLHGRRTYRVFRQRSGTVGKGPVPNEDVMHVLDSLEKIQKWHSQPSVLVMSYPSYLTLMREDSRFTYRKYMAKVLRESPGILILDEGHNPRSTKSRLRKVLMKVETDLRILLSGTLFQNNFCEYFNTLSLARPKFIKEVVKELDPKLKKKNKGVKKPVRLSEFRARKLFIDNIASKIDSDRTEERKEGLNKLKKMTNSFIDVYEGGPSDMLPGLQIYTIMMNSTDVQHEILVKLQKTMEKYDGYPLELELLITLAAIHPWLIKTSVCVNKFYSPEELTEFEKLKFDAKKGSKVMFVLNLVYRVVREEKVLMFCHNIAPINLFVELFETVFKWERGKEILVLTGDLELFERGRIMDQFEESNESRILLASITASAEGISLTAASRVIMLDSEWNPSKTKQAIARAFRPGQQKVVYVYQLLATGTIEEDKYRRTTWKEWVSSMIFSEAFAEDPSRWQAEKIEDDVLREMVEEERLKSVKSFNKIMKNEKTSTS